MKNKRLTLFITSLLLAAILLLAFTACASNPGKYKDEGSFPSAGGENTPWGDDDWKPSDNAVRENPVIDVSEQNDLYFSIDAHTAAYSQLKNMLLDKNSYRDSYASYVKIDQMLNYFDYDYSTPEGDELLALNASIFDCPYNNAKKLLRIGLTAKKVEFSDTRNNIVLLLDVSGSMYGETKIDLMKEAMIQMINNVNPEDKVSIVTYSNTTKIIADGLSAGSDVKTLTRKINELRADGGTNGSGGIQTAYEVAKKHFIAEGNNRVILATDGDFNIGISDEGELKEFIAAKRDDGIYLTCIGLGNNYDYSTSTMEALAKSGNGYWGYIHNMKDAQKLLVDDLSSTIITIAKDVKAKIVFNGDTVKNYRLLGYENNIISSDDFEDKKTDAGEIGTGFTLSLCFEIQLNEDADLSQIQNIAKVNVRYKDAKANKDDPSQEAELPINSDCITASLSNDDAFVSSVVEFALLLLNSKHKGDANLNSVIQRLQSIELNDEYKEEFLQVVYAYQRKVSAE